MTRPIINIADVELQSMPPAFAPKGLATARLELRPITANDFDAFYDALVADPDVMRFYHSYRALSDVAARRAKAARDFFAHFDEGARLHGYVAWGLWGNAQLAGGEGRFVGWCGVTTPALPELGRGPELQYMLATGWQGRGLAVEAARAVVAKIG